MAWRKTEEEYIAAAIARALRRDPIANGNRATRGFVQSIADLIERNEIKITVVRKPDEQPRG
jgi:hypothetical protein